MAAPLCPLCLERTCPEGKRLCTVCGSYDPVGFNRPLEDIGVPPELETIRGDRDRELARFPVATPRGSLVPVARNIWIRADKAETFKRIREGGHN